MVIWWSGDLTKRSHDPTWIHVKAGSVWYGMCPLGSTRYCWEGGTEVEHWIFWRRVSILKKQGRWKGRRREERRVHAMLEHLSSLVVLPVASYSLPLPLPLTVLSPLPVPHSFPSPLPSLSPSPCHSPHCPLTPPPSFLACCPLMWYWVVLSSHYLHSTKLQCFP